MKILCTGNPNVTGIPQSIRSIFPDTTFISRSTGNDLNTAEGKDYFRNLVKDFDVFLNVSQLGYGVQEELFHIVKESWTSGSVINIGSVVEFDKWQFLDPDAAKQKLSLRNASIDACTSSFKTTHLMVSGFKTDDNNDEDRMDPMRIAEAIEWVLKSKAHIPLLCVAKVDC